MVTTARKQTCWVPPDNGHRPRPTLVAQSAEAPALRDVETIAADSASTSNVPFGRSANVFSFGPFRLIPAERLLTESGRQVRLGSRALDILVTLVERAGDVVAKNEIMACVWPTTTVAEDNLTVHMTALRRALQDGRNGRRYVVTIPGRGYSFVGQVTPETQFSRRSVAVAQPNLTDVPRHQRPRDHAFAELIARISLQQDGTIAATAGFVPAPLALALAEALIALCQRDVLTFDLRFSDLDAAALETT